VASSVPALPDEQSAGPRSSKGERTRARLLAAAKEVFEEDGFLGARITDIADRAGLSHGSFYHYFDSKEPVFRQIAEAVDDQLGAPLVEVVLAPDSDLTPHERLREALRIFFEAYRNEVRIMGLIEQASRYDEHVDAMMLSRHERYATQVAGSIRQLQLRNRADPELDPRIAAAMVGALTDRFAELWLVQGAVDATMDEAVDQVTRMLVNALGITA
jgi:AcrR family transcriptional regulator